MGTRMAPSYANLFMGRLESRILAEAERKPDVWWRYIDDVFAIWTHGESHLKEFLQQINQVHSTIKFTAEWSFDSVTFLDVRAILKDGSIQTDLYSKPTDIHQYLAIHGQLPPPPLQASLHPHLQDEKSCLPHRVQEVQKTVCRGNRERLTHPPQWS